MDKNKNSEENKPVNLNEWLLRRGFSTPEHKFMNPDGSATSRVFKLRDKDEGKLSVDVESLTTHAVSVVDPAKHMLFRIANRIVNNLGLKTYHSPLPDDSNSAHAVILGMSKEDDITPIRLARASRRVFF